MPTITIAVPEKVTISENGTAQSVSQQQEQPSSSELDTVLKAITPFAVWLIFLTIGGGLLALYYARIGYLPEIEWTAVLIYLFLGTLIGGVIGLLLTISLFFPGAAWARFIVFDSGIYEHLSYSSSGNDTDKKLCIRSILSCLGLPFLKALLVSHLALVFGKFWYWVIALIILIITFLGMRIRFKWVLSREKSQSNALKSKQRSRFRKYFWRSLKRELTRQTRPPRSKDKLLDRETFQYAFWFTLSVLLSQLSMYVIYWLSGSPGEWFRSRLGVFAILTVICTAGCWISSHVVTMLYQHSARQAVVASLVIAGLLLFTADRFSSLSVKLMNRFGIGEDQYVNLLLTEQGAQKVFDLGLLPPEGQSRCLLPRLCDVEIFSKVGNEYFLSVGGKTFTLPKSDIISVQAKDRTDLELIERAKN